MKRRFGVCIAVIWQPALPEKPEGEEESVFVGTLLRTYITGERFPDEWFFRADFDHEGLHKLARECGCNWRPEAANDPSCVPNGNLTSNRSRKGDEGFIQSQLLGEYVDLNDSWVVGSYVDLETAKNNSENPTHTMQFLWRRPEIRTLLVEMDGRSFFREFLRSDLEMFGAMELEIHFVKTFWGVADDGDEAE